MNNIVKKLLIAVFGIGIFAGLDQWTKYLAVAHLKGKPPFVIWEGVFELFYHQNEGAAFGIFQGKMIFFFITTLVLMSVVLYVYLRLPNTKRYTLMNILCVFIMAGGIGNFIDRIIHGYVVDFLYFKLINFPIFNVADCYITVSCVLFLIAFMFIYKEEELDILFPKKKKLEE